MPWKASSVMEEKLRFVFEYELGERSMTELCQRYEIARETGYVWLRRYPDARGPRADGLGAPAGAHALGSQEAQAGARAGRAGARLAGGQHHRGAAEAGRFGGGAQEALAHRAVYRTVGTCR